MDFRENSSLFHADEFKMGKSCLSYALRIQFPSITFHSLHPIFFIQSRTSLSYELPKILDTIRLGTQIGPENAM